MIERMSAVPKSRTRILIASLIIGAFGIGVSEFLVMGLLPEIAQDLVADWYAEDADAAIAATGGLASSYALGVVCGMLLIPWALRGRSERQVVAICAASMLVLTVATALSPNLTVAIGLRFFAALTHATYMGLASLMAARALGATHHGRGAALIIGGLTIANVGGVPVLTALGAGGDWRGTFAVCAVLFAVPLLALICIVPPLPPVGSPEQNSVRQKPGWMMTALVVTVVTVLASSSFTLITFVAPISEGAQSPGGVLSVAVLMLLFGIGMNIGNFAGGALADRSAEATLAGTGALSGVGALALLLGGGNAISVALGFLLVGVSLGGLTPAAQVVYLRIAGHRQKLAASLAPGTINLGSFTGALGGGLVLAAWDADAVVLLALGLCVAGILIQLARPWTGKLGYPQGHALHQSA